MDEANREEEADLFTGAVDPNRPALAGVVGAFFALPTGMSSGTGLCTVDFNVELAVEAPYGSAAGRAQLASDQSCGCTAMTDLDRCDPNGEDTSPGLSSAFHASCSIDSS